MKGSEMENVVESVKGAAREPRSSAEDVGSRLDIRSRCGPSRIWALPRGWRTWQG